MEDTLQLKLKCDRYGRTILAHQYTTYPLRLSKLFRLDTEELNGAYLYLMNASPGLLAGDRLNLSLTLETGTTLHLTDQAATKVHAMPKEETKATTNWKIRVEAGASLEFVPEPVILFADSALEQTTKIELHSEAELFWSEILLPGRLARGECYDFRNYYSCLEIYSTTGELWFKDAMQLQGKHNPWQDRDLFAAEPILANLVLVQPQADLELLSQKLESFATADGAKLIFATSILPDRQGILVRAMAAKTSPIKKYINYALNCMRVFGDRPKLPHIAK